MLTSCGLAKCWVHCHKSPDDRFFIPTPHEGVRGKDGAANRPISKYREIHMKIRNLFKTGVPTFAVLAGAILCGVQAANAQNLLTNGDFTARTAIQTPQTNSCGYQSSTVNWTTWLNASLCFTYSGVELETDLLLGPSPNPNIPAEHLIHVRTEVINPSAAAAILATGATDGMVQVFGPSNSGPGKVLASVWVYVIRGQAGMGVGNGGDTGYSVKSSKLGQWEQLIGFNTVAPANEFILYSSDPQGSEFYATHAIACKAENFFELEACRALIGSSGPPCPGGVCQ
jgi:hypothetical protein